MTDRDPRSVIRDAAKRRTTAVDAAKQAAADISTERAERLARERTTPTTSATPPPEVEEDQT